MPFSPIKVANVLKDNKYRFDKALGNWHFHMYCWWEYKMVQSFWTNLTICIKIIKACIPFDTKISVVNVYLKEIIQKQ